MKGAFFVGSRKFELREIEDPKPGPADIVVDIEACGVCGSDIRRWKEGPEGGPVISGHEAAGIVSQVGEDLKDYSLGDRIAIAPDIHCGKCYYCQQSLFNLCDQLHFLGITQGYQGGFAEKILLSEEVLKYGVVHKIPDGLSFEHAALSEPCSSVLACHNHIGTGVHDVVVIIGAGPIGCLHTAVAHSHGAKVILSEPSEIRRQLAKAFEPELTIDPFLQDLGEAVLSYTDGLGADVVICANPVPATQTQAVEIVCKRGKVVLFGGLPKKDHMVLLDGNKIHYGEVQVIGSFSYHPIFHQYALDALQRGIIPADDIISCIYPLEEVDQAFEAAASEKALKVLVKP